MYLFLLLFSFENNRKSSRTLFIICLIRGENKMLHIVSQKLQNTHTRTKVYLSLPAVISNNSTMGRERARLCTSPTIRRYCGKNRMDGLRKCIPKPLGKPGDGYSFRRQPETRVRATVWEHPQSSTSCGFQSHLEGAYENRSSWRGLAQ